MHSLSLSSLSLKIHGGQSQQLVLHFGVNLCNLRIGGVYAVVDAVEFQARESSLHSLLTLPRYDKLLNQNSINRAFIFARSGMLNRLLCYLFCSLQSERKRERERERGKEGKRERGKEVKRERGKEG